MYFFEATEKKRILQVVCAVIWCLFGAGPIFGFAALKPALIDQGIYEEVCDVSTSPSNDSLDTSFINMFTSIIGSSAASSPLISLLDNDKLKSQSFISKCTAQDLKLNMMFTAGAAMTNVSALIIGRTLDTYGPRVCGIIGATFLTLASLIFIYAKSMTAFDPYLVGYTCMALGGPFAYISSFQLSNAFPEKSGLILALLTGAFDTSSAVFLLYIKLYLKDPSFFTLSTFYKIYLVVPIFIFVVQFFLMPTESYLTPPPELIPSNSSEEQRALSIAAAQEDDLHAENAALLGTTLPDESTTLMPASKRRSSLGDAYKSIYIEEEIQETAKAKDHLTYSIFGIFHGFPAAYQFRTWWFILMCLFATIQMLRLNYFVATVNSQYTYLFGSYKMAERLNKIFDVALPLGGVLSIPFVGMFLDNFSTSMVLLILLAFSLLIGILGVVKNSFLSGLINVLVFVCYRPFFYTSVSDYCAKVFGFETFGTVYGSIMTVSGVFNFLQGYLDKLTHTKFEMNPIPLNLLMLVITAIIGGVTVAYVFVQSRIYSRKRVQTSAIASEVS